MAGIKDLRVKLRIEALTALIKDKGDLSGRPAKEGAQRVTKVNIPEFEIPSSEFDDRVDNARLVLEYGYALADTVPPIPITDEVSDLTHNSVTLNGHVKPHSALVATTVRFQHGATKELGTTTAAAESPLASADNEPVSLAVGGLSASTQYYYRVVAIDANYPAGKAGIIKTFITDEAPA